MTDQYKLVSTFVPEKKRAILNVFSLAALYCGNSSQVVDSIARSVFTSYAKLKEGVFFCLIYGI